MKKVFLIGMNRCGTKSFHELFKESGYRSHHYSCLCKGQATILAQKMKENEESFHPLLFEIDDAHVYSDMFWHREDEWIDGVKYFKKLYREYPDSYFILQTRNMYTWLKSKRNHKKGAYIKRCCEHWNMTTDQMIDWFEKDRIEHHANVHKFFEGKENFLEFDIEKDNISDLIQFLKPSFFLDEKHWGHHGKTV